MKNDSKQVFVFCLIVFGLTYLVEAWLWLSGGLEVWFAFAVLIGVMFIPLLSAVIMIRLVEHGSLRDYGIARGRLRYYLYSLICPIRLNSSFLLCEFQYFLFSRSYSVSECSTFSDCMVYYSTSPSFSKRERIAPGFL